MKLVWSATAFQQLEAIHDYLSPHSPAYAVRLLERIITRAENLLNFPLNGGAAHEFDEEGVRELLENRIGFFIKSQTTTSKFWQSCMPLETIAVALMVNPFSHPLLTHQG